jgi:hypothetical protein
MPHAAISLSSLRRPPPDPIPPYQRNLQKLEAAILCRKISTGACCFFSPCCWYGAFASDKEDHDPFSSLGCVPGIILNEWGGQCRREKEYFLLHKELPIYEISLKAAHIASQVFPNVNGDTYNGLSHAILQYSYEPPPNQTMA